MKSRIGLAVFLIAVGLAPRAEANRSDGDCSAFSSAETTLLGSNPNTALVAVDTCERQSRALLKLAIREESAEQREILYLKSESARLAAEAIYWAFKAR